MTERLPTVAFGKAFTHIPEHVRSDLDTLERECAIYTDHWIDEIGDFRHVRVPFTTKEREEFARRSWAYELFCRAGGPYWASDTPGIDADIAQEADAYTGQYQDGTIIPPPYHCFAAFLGEHLEELVCFNTDRMEVIELTGKAAALFEVKRAIQSLTATIRSFNHREKGLTPWPITCEDDARDLLYVMLRSRIFDITKESAVPPRAGRHRFVDLCSDGLGLLVELKWIDKPGAWKNIVDQIHVDVQTYHGHPSCENHWFVIVDNIKDIQDPRLVEEQWSGSQAIGGKQFEVQVIVCDT